MDDERASLLGLLFMCVLRFFSFFHVRMTIEKHRETLELFCDILGIIFGHSELFLCVLSLFTNEN